MIFRLLLILSFGLVSCQHLSQDEQTQASEANLKYILPKTMTFAGVRIDLTDEDIMERLDREVLINENFRANTIQIIKRANRFFPIISDILKKENVPDDFKYLATIESSLTNTASPAGAEGFWQIMPETANEYGLTINDEVDERHHLEKSTRAAAKYLKNANRKLNNWISTAASYNRGVSGFLKDQEWQGMNHYFDMHMNAETGRYVFRILAMKLIMEDPKKYGFEIPEAAKYNPYKLVDVSVNEPIENLVSWSNAQGFNYKILKKLNPWVKTLKLTPKDSTSFIIQLPAPDYKMKRYSAQ